MGKVRKFKKRHLMLQALEERILWDATMQPEPPEQEVADEQQQVDSNQVADEQVIVSQDDETPDTELSEQNPDETDETPEDDTLSEQTDELTDEATDTELAEGEEGALEGEESTEDTETEASVEVVVVDSSIENHQQIVDDIVQQNKDDDSRKIRIITIDSSQGGIDQVTDILAASEEPVDALHIVSHGSDNQIYLGADRITSERLEEQQQSLSNWSQYMSETADILVYGCDVAETQDGQNLLQELSEITGADVAASTDDTGTTEQGGDWKLEYASGEIEANVLLADTGQNNWSGVLALDPPVGTIGAPGLTMIDESPTITLNFDSPAGSDTGYAPYGDFVIERGVDINSISYLGANVNYVEVGTLNALGDWEDSGGGIIATHPLDNKAAAALPLASTVGLDEGATWYAIELPFGSFTEDQPPVDLTVRTDFNADAVVGTPIDLTWTPGYLLGDSAVGNVPISGATLSSSITPDVIQIEKTDDLPESETPTGPNYPVEYTITVNIAQGETVDDVVVTDYLPSNAVFLGDATLDPTTVTITPINGAAAPVAPVINVVGTEITVELGSVTGTAVGAGEIEITYYAYFQDIVTTPSPNGVPNINHVPSLNESSVTGQHNGITVTDSGDNDTAGADGLVDDGDNQIDVQNITTQKTPKKVTGFNPDGSPILAALNNVTPGELIHWTVDIQISDYHAFDNLFFTDQLSDGQSFIDGTSDFILRGGATALAAYLRPTLSVNNDSDFGGNTDDTTVSPITFDAAHVYTAGETPPGTMDVNDGSLTDVPGTSATGEVTTIFDISNQLRANGTDGVLVGDLNNINDLDGDTSDSPLPGDITIPRLGANATTLTLTFYSTVNESYVNVPGVGEANINSGDPIGNDGEIQGEVGDVADDGTFTADPAVSDPLIDDTSHQIEVTTPSIEKTIYAINGIEVQNPDFFNGSANPDEDDNESDEAIVSGIQPGDLVTYRLRAELSSANAENYVITDFLPLPVFDVDADFAVDPVFSNNPGDAPVTGNFNAGDVQYGEDYNLHTVGADFEIVVPPDGVTAGAHPANNIFPDVSLDAANNKLIFDFGTFIEEDTGASGGSTNVVLDLLLTVQVTDQPMAETLYLTNQTQSSQSDSFGNEVKQEDIVQIEYVVPELNIVKGVVAVNTDSDGSLSTTAPNFGVNFANTDPGSGTPATNSLDFAGNTISLSDISTNSGILNANATGVDGGDSVRYAVTVHNTGEGDAQDILIKDTLPVDESGFVIPSDSNDTTTVINSLNLQLYYGDGTRIADTDFTAQIVGGELFVDISAEIDGATYDSMGNEIADSDEILTDPNPGNGNASEVKNTINGDEVILIVYDLEVDNETVLDSSTVTADSTYTNTASVEEYYQTPEGDPLRNAGNQLTDLNGKPSDDAQVTTAGVTVVKDIVSTELNTTNNNEDREVVIGERITYEVLISIPEGQLIEAQLEDTLDRGLELSSIDSVRFVDQNRNSVAAHVSTDATSGGTVYTEYGAADADGNILSSPITTETGPVDYNFKDNGKSIIKLDLGTITNTNNDTSIEEFVLVTYTVMVTNDSSNNSGTKRNNDAKLNWDVPDPDNPGSTISKSSATDKAPNATVLEPELEVVKTVSVDGVNSTGNANDEVNPDTALGDNGDSVTYTIVIQHTGDSDTDAYDVTIDDVIPSDIVSVNLVSAVYSKDSSDLAGTDIVLAGNTLSTANDFTVELGETITITVTGTMDSGLVSGDDIDNTADITWTSYPETPDTSDFVPAGQEDVERGGGPSAPAGGETNDYDDTDVARITVGNSVEKFLVNSEITNEADATADGQLAAINDSDAINSGAEAVIGEILTYEIVISLAEGVTNNAVIKDTLDPGLVLTSINSIQSQQLDTNTSSIINVNSVPNLTVPNLGGLGLPATDDSNANITYTHNAGNAGSDVLEIALGNINNSNNDDDIIEQIVVNYSVMVTDISANTGNDAGTAGTQLNNAVELTYEDSLGNTDSSGTNSADTIEVIEPDLEVVKDVSVSGPGDAGDQVTYTITIRHTADSEADAFDVSLRDVLPEQVDFSAVNFATATNVSITDTDGVLTTSDLEIATSGADDILQFANTANTDTEDSLNTIDFGLSGTARVVTVTISGTLLGTVEPGDMINNEAEITYSSLDEHNDGAPDNDDEDDRSGFAPGGEGKERIYTDSDSADTVTVGSPTIAKTLVSTDVTTNGNTNNQATIGEIVTYRVTIGLPEGALSNAQIVDSLDAGLEFVDITSITGTANGSSVVSDLAGGGIEVASNANLIDSTSGSAATGQTVTFDLGNLTVTGDNAGSGAVDQGADQIIIEYRAVVKDIAGNVDGNSGIDNSAVFNFSTTNELGATVNQSTGPVDAEDISLVEPELEVIKTINGLADGVNAADLDAGDSVSYTITIQHTGDSSTTAFDVNLADTLPTEIDFSAVDFALGNNVSVTDTAGTLGTSDFAINAGVLNFDIDGDLTSPTTQDIELARVITITINGTIKDSSTPNDTVTNTASITWTSLPEGHENDGAADERGEEGAGGPYDDSDSAAYTTDSPEFSKQVISGSIHGDTDTDTQIDLTIGEEVTFELVATLNEGTTPLVITDRLPPLPALAPFVGDADGVLEFVRAEVSFVGAGVSNTGNLSLGDTNVSEPGFIVVTDEDAGVSGGNDQVVFNFGTVVVDGNNVTAADDNVIKVTVTAVVANTTGGAVNHNANGDELTNEATLNFSATPGTPGAGEVLYDTASVDVLEPELNISKEFIDPTTGDPVLEVTSGQQVRVRLTVENTGTANAYDVVITDAINNDDAVFINPAAVTTPAGFTFNFNDQGNANIADDVVTFSANNGIFIPPLSGAPSNELVFEFDVTLTDSVVSDDFSSLRIENTASVTGDSLDGDPTLASGAANTHQRVTSDSADDYLIGKPDFDKSVFSTTVADTGNSQFDNSLEDVTIGERVTYEIVFDIPDSDFDNDGTAEAVALTLTDNLPDTLELTNATVVSIGSDISSANLSVGDNLLGSANITGSDNNADTFNDRVVFNFGNTTVDDTNNDNSDQQIVVRVEAIVKNHANNFQEDGSDPADNAINDKVNQAQLVFGSLTMNDSATVEVVEPKLEITKNFVDPTTGQPIFTANAGDVVQIELSVTNTGSAVAYDVEVEDDLSASVTAGHIVSGSAAVVLVDADFTDSSNIAGNSIVFDSGRLNPGETNTFRINVTLDAGLLVAGQSIDNTATIEGDSLPDTSADTAEARTTSDSDDDSLFGIPSISKEVADNYTHTGDADTLATSHTGTDSSLFDAGLVDLTVGEVVTYEVSIVLPDTFNSGDIVLVPTSIVDNLPSGLGLVDARVVAIGGNLTIGESDGGEIVTDTTAGASTTGAASTNLAVGDSLLGGSGSITGTVGGSSVSFNFGGIGIDTTIVDENSDTVFERENTASFTDTVGSEQTIVVQIDAVVIDNAQSVPGSNPFVNTAQLTWEQVTGSPVVISDTANVDVVEPELEITKSFKEVATGFDAYTVNAGQQLLVQLEVNNTGSARAYDVVVSDELDLNLWTNITAQTTPPGFTFSIGNGSNPTASDTVTFTMDSVSGAGISDPDNYIAPSETLVFEFLVEYTGNAGAAVQLDNTAEVIGDALPESLVPTLLNPDGSNAGVDTTRQTSDSDTDTVYEVPELVKEVIEGLNPKTDKSQFDRTIEDLAIGEQVVYELKITLPESPLDNVGSQIPINVRLVDDLPDAFAVVSAEVTDMGAAITSPNLVVGDDLQVLDPITLAPSAGGSTANIAASDSNYLADASEDKVVFDFGAVQVADVNDTSQQTITVQVTAVVLDISPENDEGELRTNNATLEFYASPTGNNANPFDTANPLTFTDSADVEIVKIPDPLIPGTPISTSGPAGVSLESAEVSSDNGIFAFFRYDMPDRLRLGFEEFMEEIREDIKNKLPKLPVHYMATGITEHGSNVTMMVYNESGAIIGYKTVMADTAGNWLMTFPQLILDEAPHHVEVHITPASYNDSTSGEFNTRVYYTPAIESRHFHSKSLTFNQVMAEKADNILDSQHKGYNNPLGEYGDDWNHPYEFLAIGNTERI